MSVQPEAKFKRHLQKAFKLAYADWPGQCYWLPLVASAFQRAGIPDVYVGAWGKSSSWIEAKANDGRPSKIQDKEFSDMRRAGIRVVILYADMRIPEKNRAVLLFPAEFGRHTCTYGWANLDKAFWDMVLFSNQPVIL